jgi:signal transduction histidine kinase/CheY-like chemotaxis protein
MTDVLAFRPETVPLGPAVFRSDGEMAALMREIEWAATPLGPVHSWPVSLRSTVSTLLASRHAMFLWWGPDLIQFYNDGYRQSLGPDRHPSALGHRGRVCWAEIWPTIGPEVESIMAGGPSTWHEDHLVPITRGDRVHDVYWSYSYSPVQDDAGSVGGVLVTVQETTRRVIGERRVRLVRDLVTALQAPRTPDDACGAAAGTLASAQRDLAFSLFYLIEPDGRTFRLAAGEGLASGSRWAPETLRITDESPWPVARALSSEAVEGEPQRTVPSEPIGPAARPEPVREVLTFPIVSAAGARQLHGILVAGLNPRIPCDEAYSEFVRQIARETASALDRIARERKDREAARIAARAERELLENVFELAPSFLAVLRGPDHRFELVNPAYYQLVGHRELLGRTVEEAIPELAGQGFIELLDRVFRTGEPFIGNELAVELQSTPGGALASRYVNLVYQAIRGEDGEVAGLLATGVDVTALVHTRKAVEQALVETERLASERDAERQKLLTVLEQSPLAVAIIEAPGGRILFLNSKFAEIFGYAVDLEHFAAYSDYYHGLHPDGRRIGSEEWPIVQALRTGEVITGRILEIVQASGRRVQIDANAAPVRDAEGRIIAAVAIFRDVTAERRTERQLRDAQRIQAVGTLAGGVAHEVNNQMTAVLGFGEFVLRALGPHHPQADDMRLVMRSAERAARVSQQLLAFTRQQVMRPTVVELPELVARLAPVLRQLLGADKQLLTPSAGPLPPISADADQVEQVLINLVANARDATDTGGRVTISLAAVVLETELPATATEPVAPGRYVRLSVADTGHGMSPGTLERVFDPFFTTKDVGKGTGLGLSMVYGTLRRHGGYVRAASAPGAGTTMELYWPIAVGPVGASGGVDADQPGEAASGGAVVLVAEDEPAVRALVARTLREGGYVVAEAADGRAAFEMIDGGAVHPDLIVTDVVMPELNGRQLHDAIRARWPAMPVLFTSGHTGEAGVLERLVPAGAAFLGKPFTTEALRRAVDELLATVRPHE